MKPTMLKINDQKELALLFDINALCDLEEATGKNFQAIVNEMRAGPAEFSMKTMRAITWAGLQAHHPEIDLAGAGRIITECGGVSAAMEKIAEAFAATTGQGE